MPARDPATRAWKRVALGAGVVLIVGAWTSPWLPALPLPWVRPRVRFELGTRAFTVRLPRAYVTPCPGMADLLIVATPKPPEPGVGPRHPSFVAFCERGTRRMRSVNFELAGPESSQGSPSGTWHRLLHGTLENVLIDRDLGGGSGGTEGEMTALLRVDGEVLSIRCHDQSDGLGPRPEWCVQYLHSLRASEEAP